MSQTVAEFLGARRCAMRKLPAGLPEGEREQLTSEFVRWATGDGLPEKFRSADRGHWAEHDPGEHIDDAFDRWWGARPQPKARE